VQLMVRGWVSIVSYYVVSFPDSFPEIALYPGEDIRIGRESHLEPSTSRMTFKNYVIHDDRVSKKHFRVYSIIYEQKKSHDTQTPELPPLVYCEDLESSNGTYVNGHLIGIIGKEKVPRLLCDGDVIEIRPSWKFTFHQSNHYMVFPTTTQSRDMEVCDLLPSGKSALMFLSTFLIDILSLTEYLDLGIMGTYIWGPSCLLISRLRARSLTWTRPYETFRYPVVITPPLALVGDQEWSLPESRGKRLWWKLRFYPN
jgi:FHA domain